MFKTLLIRNRYKGEQFITFRGPICLKLWQQLPSNVIQTLADGLTLVKIYMAP